MRGSNASDEPGDDTSTNWRLVSESAIRGDFAQWRNHKARGADDAVAGLPGGTRRRSCQQRRVVESRVGRRDCDTGLGLSKRGKFATVAGRRSQATDVYRNGATTWVSASGEG